MRKRMLLAGTLVIASVTAGGTPAHAATSRPTAAAVKKPCWMVVHAVKPMFKKWGHDTVIAAKAYVSEPSLCNKKRISIGLEYKSSANGRWASEQRADWTMNKKDKYYYGWYSTSWPCGWYIRSAYTLDRSTWIGKTYRVTTC
ncbi:MAG: hypothetical protein JWN52_3729 [Actinomycetia bacterium]|nr:hypothetical protein [Actinomycetes bacterium]